MFIGVTKLRNPRSFQAREIYMLGKVPGLRKWTREEGGDIVQWVELLSCIQLTLVWFLAPSLVPPSPTERVFLRAKN